MDAWQPTPRHPGRRRFLLAALLLPAPLLAQAAASAMDELWHDPKRRRDVPVRIRWPEGAPLAGGFPVILYSHGLGGSRDGGDVWGSAWVAAGFVVVHLQHPGSDTPALRAAWAGQAGLGQAASPAQLIARAEDVRFALDTVEQRQARREGQWSAIRPKAFGLAGHSFGAHTVLATAGRRYPGSVTLQDPRVAAFVALSPTLPSNDERAALTGVTRPLLCITGTLDGDVVGNGTTPERRAGVFDALPAGAKALLLLKDADHATFGGNAQRRGLPGQRRAPETMRLEDAQHQLVARITADWWRAHLEADAEARTRLAQPTGLAAGDRWQRG